MWGKLTLLLLLFAPVRFPAFEESVRMYDGVVGELGVPVAPVAPWSIGDPNRPASILSIVSRCRCAALRDGMCQ